MNECWMREVRVSGREGHAREEARAVKHPRETGYCVEERLDPAMVSHTYNLRMTGRSDEATKRRSDEERNHVQIIDNVRLWHVDGPPGPEEVQE